jgi:U1 small nuclear ribonucleoprotein 70kDa
MKTMCKVRILAALAGLARNAKVWLLLTFGSYAYKELLFSSSDHESSAAPSILFSSIRFLAVTMTDKLPTPLLTLFQPRPPLRYIPPQDTAPETRASKTSQLSGIAGFLPALAEYSATDEYHPTESWLQRRDRLRKEKMDRQSEIMKDSFEGFRPEEDYKIKGDAVKTLFVARLAYDAREADLEREFGKFGPIERIRIVRNEHEKNPKKQHRGYAFVVYERERDMKGNDSPS